MYCTGSPTKKNINGDGKKKQNFFKSALVKIRSKQNDHSKQKELKPIKVSAEVEAVPKSNDDWKMIVGSMRPLHIPDTSSPPTIIANMKPLRAVRSVENFEDIFLAPPSPTYSTTSSGGTMSQYASAVDLHELDKSYGGGCDREVDDSIFEKHSADVMIDTKAEEFISHFYEQMRLQLNPVAKAKISE